MSEIGSALTHVVLQLRPFRFARLMTFITDPDGKLRSGGYQDRKARWRMSINEAARSVELNTDDVGWIQRQIKNVKGGGWEKKVSDIFVDEHELFTGLPTLPRKKPHERKRRTRKLTAAEIRNNPMSVTTVVSTPGFSWSYSVLKNFETCPRRYYSYNVARDVTEPESEPIKYGHAVHKAFQDRVRSGTRLPLGMGMHEPILAKLASAPGEIHTEQKLGLSSSFSPTSFMGAGVWFRIVLDYTNIREGGTATVVDYKTGRPDDDLTQLKLSAATLFAHDARIQRVKAALLFIAHEQIESAEFVRNQTTEIWSEILPRVRQVIEARQKQHYPPKPGGLCRRHCAVASCPFHGK